MIKLNCTGTFYVDGEALGNHTTVAVDKENDESSVFDKEEIPESAKIVHEEKLNTTRYDIEEPMLNLTINGKTTRLTYEGKEAFEKRDADYETLTRIMEPHDKG